MRHIIPRGLPAAPSLGQRRQDIGHSEIPRQRRFPLQFGLDELSQVRRQLDRRQLFLNLRDCSFLVLQEDANRRLVTEDKTGGDRRPITINLKAGDAGTNVQRG